MTKPIPSSRGAAIAGRLIQDPRSAFAVDQAPGTWRGIDVYPTRELIQAIDESLKRYSQAHGEPAPDPEKASLLREKMLWSKFFRPMAIPTPADKLAAYSMLSPEAKRLVKEPPKVWRSTQGRLPFNEQIAPGAYWLKLNNSCGANMRVVFPINEKNRAWLEGLTTPSLEKKYGRPWGEWWYCLIKPRLFLEKELDLPKDPPSEFKFYVVNGRISHLHVKWPTDEGEATSVYDRDLKFLDVKYKGRPNARRKLASRVADVAAIAEQLTQGMDFVRIDLYLDRNDEIWFGEYTYAPADGLASYSSREFEAECCREWDVGAYLYPNGRSYGSARSR
jgi:hypothetical protein